VNKEFSRRLELLNSSLVELARARDEWDSATGPVDMSGPVGQAFERAVIEYEAADEEMLAFMSRMTGRAIRHTAREPMDAEPMHTEPIGPGVIDWEAESDPE
jgi:hypothetical protein